MKRRSTGWHGRLRRCEKLDERGATQRITDVLAKSAKGRRMAEESAEAAAAGDDSGVAAA